MSSPRRSFTAGGSSSPSHDRWLLSYADFVTLLLAVFIVLFASMRHKQGSIRTVSTAIHSGFESLGAIYVPAYKVSVGQHANQIQKPASRPENVAQLAQQLQSVLGDPISKHEVVVQLTPDGLILRLEDLGFFESGNAALLPSAVQELTRAARILKHHNLEVRVEGHSDDQPIRTAAFHSNWDLSTARAMSVLSVLVDRTGFPPDRIAVMGYGPYRPIADNATEEGRRRNRRVDLVIVTPHTGQDFPQ